ncbi:Uncharacterized protein Rs2_31957 [Raphanus sativus]|nr:Uncharacterized protein Rs2_31957 [Raphanus sativus]
MLKTGSFDGLVYRGQVFLIEQNEGVFELSLRSRLANNGTTCGSKKTPFVLDTNSLCNNNNLTKIKTNDPIPRRECTSFLFILALLIRSAFLEHEANDRSYLQLLVVTMD